MKLAHKLSIVLVATAVTTLPCPGAIKTGPELNQRIPPFSAVDQNGRTQTLETIAGPKGAMLVFYRSADW